jgi:hypothetical protein
MAPPTDSPPPSLTFADAFVPTLLAGAYTLTATQDLYANTTGEKIEPLRASKTFWVAAPRFSLAPDEIYSLYPPDGHSGAYHTTVPHVVCRRKALPWERPLVAKEPGRTPAEPWMALLLFEEEELLESPFEVKSFEDVVKPPGDMRGPLIDLAPWEQKDDHCTVLDVPWKLFCKLAPRRADLPYLAHARLVATQDKEDIHGIDDGWFSVVLANRLPAKDKRNIAVLVSLEGHHDLIEDKQPDRGTTNKVRLVVLARWTFESKGDTFAEGVKALYENRDMWLRAADGKDTKNACLATALELGYVPLQHRLRHGDSTVSWYRGPLVPVWAPDRSLNLIFANADEALQYDNDTGLLDASYAAAWQLGRLLALQAPEFARALFHMESGHVAQVLINEAENTFPPESATDQATLAQRAARLARDDLMSAIVLEWSA